jgi:hypothetical protein
MPQPELDFAAWRIASCRRTARALVALVRRFAPEFDNRMPLWALQELWGSPAAGDPLDDDVLIGLEAVGELQFFEVADPDTLTANQLCACIEHDPSINGPPRLLAYVGIPLVGQEAPTSASWLPPGTFAEVIAEMQRQEATDRNYEEAAAAEHPEDPERERQELELQDLQAAVPAEHR